jgi:hypothetical protein
MSFVSDLRTFRTLDTESGWELFVTSSFNHYEFRLVGPSEQEIAFCGTQIDVSKIDRPGLKPEFSVHWRVYAVSPFNPVTKRKIEVPGRIELIRNALRAYGTVHNGPLGRVQIDMV